MTSPKKIQWIYKKNNKRLVLALAVASHWHAEIGIGFDIAIAIAILLQTTTLFGSISSRFFLV
jgi:hypothetical protein